jgi:hypothetical protein
MKLDTLPEHDEGAPMEGALALARWGLPVFPLKPGSKVPATARGFKDASRNPVVIRERWGRNPRYGVGVATGHGLTVVDMDVNGVDGGDTLAELERKHGKLPDAPMALTGSGGAHWYFLAPRDTPTRPRFAPGLDLKAIGGYVVAPPSLHPNGEPYRWDVGDHPTERPLAPIPKWLLENGKRHNPGPAPALPKKLSSGQGRNTALASLAGTMRRRGAEEGAILAGLRAENAAYAEPLDDAEVEKIARSVGRYPPIVSEEGDRPKEAIRLEPLPWQRLLAEGVPEIEYIEEPYFPKGARIWIWGVTGTSKSLLALMKAAEWSRRGLKVAYFSEENPLAEEIRRVALVHPDPERFRMYHRSGANLADPGWQAALLAVADWADVVILDAWTDLWAGDENENREVQQFDATVLKPLQERGATPVVIHHEGHPSAFVKRGGATAGRGASSLGQKADVTLQFKADRDGAFTIVYGKARIGGRRQPDRTFRIEDAQGGLEIVEVASEAAEAVEEMVERAVAAIQAAENGLTMSEIRAVCQAGRDRQNAALELLKADSRVRSGPEKRGRARPTVWRPAGEGLL